MKREIRTGPKRLRWTRRDWSGAYGLGQSRRWDDSDGKFKTEREARRAGLTGKLTKHDPNVVTAVAYGEPFLAVSRPARGVIVIGEPTPFTEFMTLRILMERIFGTDPSPAPATGEREAGSTSSRNTERSSEEE
jgi:hypothetical protein